MMNPNDLAAFIIGMKNKKFSIANGIQSAAILKTNTHKPTSLNHFEVEFDGSIINVDLAKELAIDEEDLVTSMTQHAGNYGWWAGLSTTAKRYLKSLERDREDIMDGLDMQARCALQGNNIKVTEAGVTAYVRSDPRTKKVNEDIAMLKDIVDFSEVVLRGLEHKRDMLREINRAQLGERYSERN